MKISLCAVLQYHSTYLATSLRDQSETTRDVLSVRGHGSQDQEKDKTIPGFEGSIQVC